MVVKCLRHVIFYSHVVPTMKHREIVGLPVVQPLRGKWSLVCNSQLLKRLLLRMGLRRGYKIDCRDTCNSRQWQPWLHCRL